MADETPETARLRGQVIRTGNRGEPRVRLADAVRAVQDTEKRVREEAAVRYWTSGAVLREVGDALRNSTLTSTEKVSQIAAVMANGPLDAAPGGPCEDAAFAARHDAFLEEARADADRLFTALDAYIMARITGTDLRTYDDLAERAARAHRRLTRGRSDG